MFIPEGRSSSEQRLAPAPFPQARPPKAQAPGPRCAHHAWKEPRVLDQNPESVQGHCQPPAAAPVRASQASISCCLGAGCGVPAPQRVPSRGAAASGFPTRVGLAPREALQEPLNSLPLGRRGRRAAYLRGRTACSLASCPQPARMARVPSTPGLLAHSLARRSIPT